MTQQKELAKYICAIELKYQDNYRKLSNEKRKRIRAYLDKKTEELYKAVFEEQQI